MSVKCHFNELEDITTLHLDMKINNILRREQYVQAWCGEQLHEQIH